jgi:hypothetical protein
MKVGDIFYSVMQKDNCPFEKPRITKFVVEKIDTAHSYPFVSTKTDKWGRHYAFRKDQIHLTYEDALVEKNKIIARIEKWEEERREQDRLYFEEQERKEKQRQIEHDNQVRKEVVQEIWKEFEQRLMGKKEDMPVIKVANMINSVLDQALGENK